MRIFLAVAIVLLCVSTLDATSIYRKAESNAATDPVRRDLTSQSKQANQIGINTANQGQVLNGYGNQIEQNQQNNLEGDRLSNQAQFSYGGGQTLQDKPLYQIGKNVANVENIGNQPSYIVGGSQIKPKQQDNVSNKVQSSYGGKQALQSKQLNQNGRNVANQDQGFNGSGKQIEQNQQNNEEGDNISNQVQVQGPFEKDVNTVDNTRFNAAIKSGAYNNPNLAQVGDNSQFDPINQNGLYNNAAVKFQIIK